ncbi:transglycosylase domain-containing protein [Sporosarcina siberiensis]|uniref:Transglycosylase domain-containing protein n=1 Tax=Sporosarcina siberiensis TaxID=1365606 RepID=A0ABW4SCL5_9BACL
MSEQNKKPIKLIEEKIDALAQTKWAKGLRITSGVIWNLFLLFIIIGVTVFIFAGSIGAGYFASLVAKEPLRSEQEMRNTILSYEETSELYLADGVYLGKVNSDIERKEVKLKDVSQHVIDAVLATEDEYFESHTGIVPKAIFRGLLQDVTNSDTQTGGSTLTQQLIKIQILTNEVSYERKAKEILLAMRLEKFMKKEEILEAYLNIIPYGRNSVGQNIAGIETAAEGIFNVKAKDLTLPQAAYIAGIPQAPFAYTPFYSSNLGQKEPENLKPGINRMMTVLFRMKETGYISEQQYNEAIAYDITQDFREPTQRANERYPFLTQEIQNRTIEILAKVLAEKDGVDPNRFEEEKKIEEKYTILAQRSMRVDGYRIHSTINKEMYDEFQKISNEFKNYGHTFVAIEKDPDTGEDKEVLNPVQVGSVAIENSTGKILAFIGGRDYEIENLNHSTQAFRPNGSSMKPLLVYAPAIEYGEVSAGSPIADVWYETTKYGGVKYSPKNFITNEQMGLISARQALASSQNVAATRLYEKIIDRKPVDFLKKMGFSQVTPAHYGSLAVALGTIDASVEENTNAFSTLANDGQFIDSYMIEKIEDMNGNIIFEHKVEPVDVFSPETAYIVTDMLHDVLTGPRGTGQLMKKNLNFNIDLAAKTGTTQGFGDVWLVGYNPNISLGVWLGYKSRLTTLDTASNRYGQPSTRVNLLFAELMNGMNRSSPEIVKAESKFQKPDGVVSRSFCGISGLAPSLACTNAGLIRTDLFNSKVFLPTQEDDSLISSSYVLMNGVKYSALAETPSAFIRAGGIGLNQKFIDRIFSPFGGDPAYLFPNNSGFANNVVAGKSFVPDDAAPAAVSASLNNTTMTWGNSASSDVIGYYVYRVDNGSSSLVSTITDSDSNSYNIGAGSYFVRAVDITGRQSAPSNIVQIKIEEEVIEVTPPETEEPVNPPVEEIVPPPSSEEEVNPTPPEEEVDEE